MQKITPFLWFDGQAEEAVQYYSTVFPDVKVLNLVRYGKGGPGPEGSVLTIAFEMLGQRFTALNGGPMYHFTEAVSFVIDCETQEEVDHYWDALIANGGQPGRCGWLKDRFGLSWQVVPRQLPKLLAEKDAAKASRVMQAMMQMQKIDIATLENARDGIGEMTAL